MCMFVCFIFFMFNEITIGIFLHLTALPKYQSISIKVVSEFCMYYLQHGIQFETIHTSYTYRKLRLSICTALVLTVNMFDYDDHNI